VDTTVRPLPLRCSIEFVAVDQIVLAACGVEQARFGVVAGGGARSDHLPSVARSLIRRPRALAAHRRWAPRRSSRRSGRATRSSRPGAARRSGRGRPRRPRVSGRSARRGCPRAPTRSSSCAAPGSRPAPVNRTSTCWPAWWPGQPGTSKTMVFACGVSTRTSTSSASRQVSRPGSAVPAMGHRGCGSRSSPRSRARRSRGAAGRAPTWRSSRSSGDRRACAQGHRARPRAVDHGRVRFERLPDADRRGRGRQAHSRCWSLRTKAAVAPRNAGWSIHGRAGFGPWSALITAAHEREVA
jgi:hypothetical protein